MDRFVGTGTEFSSYNRHQRNIVSSLSVPGSSFPTSADQIKNGFSRSVLLNKKLHSSEVESYPKELDFRTTESELSSSTIKERNGTNNPPINRAPDIQIGKPVFVTFENNSKFRIPISAEVHERNNISTPRQNVENIMMETMPRSPSRHTKDNQEVSLQINLAVFS